MVAFAFSKARRLVGRPFVAVATLSLLAACASFQLGPKRPITINDDVALVKPIAEPDLANFYSLPPLAQAATRNEIITARMYIADLEYNKYEAVLTREMQAEGLAATATSLGLTTSATLIPELQTAQILSGAATAVTGLDKAYSQKDLLSNTIQALQTQMRADRKAEAAAIYSKMFSDINDQVITPISQYTLPMALSDADRYYQAGTLASALIGLTKTVTRADTNAQNAKDNAGPNAPKVVLARVTAAPSTLTSARPSIIRNVNTPLPRFNPPPPPASPNTRLGRYEIKMPRNDMNMALDILGCKGKDLGPSGSQARRALAKFLTDNGKPSSDRLTDASFFDLRDIKATGKQGTCSP